MWRKDRATVSEKLQVSLPVTPVGSQRSPYSVRWRSHNSSATVRVKSLLGAGQASLLFVSETHVRIVDGHRPLQQEVCALWPRVIPAPGPRRSRAGNLSWGIDALRGGQGTPKWQDSDHPGHGERQCQSRPPGGSGPELTHLGRWRHG